MNLRHFAIVILGGISIFGLVDIIGIYVFELIIIGYLFSYFIANIVLFVVSLIGYRKDIGSSKQIDLFGLIISVGSVVITFSYFVYAWFNQ